MCTSDKRLTGLSDDHREQLAVFMRNQAEVWKKYSPHSDVQAVADAYEYLAELVESAGREGE